MSAICSRIGELIESFQLYLDAGADVLVERAVRWRAKFS